MSEQTPWGDMGIADEELFTAKALEYWKRESVDAFFFGIIHEIGPHVNVARSILTLATDYIDFEAVELPLDLNGKWIYDSVLKKLNQLEELNLLIALYAQFLRDSKSSEDKG